jgi:Fic family protein
MKVTRRQLKRIIKESLEELSPVLQDEITRAKFRGVSRNDVNSALARGGDDEKLALEISILRRTLREAEEQPKPSDQGLVDFIVRSNQIEGYNLDPEEVREAVAAYNDGESLSYIRNWGPNHKHIVAHLQGIEAAKGGVSSVSDVIHVHGAMGPDVLDAGAPGMLRSGVEAQSAGGTKYVPSTDVPEALSWWSERGWSNPLEAHTVYELIHPFADGNGRSGRIIMAAMMGFNYDAVNGLIGGGYFSSLDSVGSKYQGEFWKE